MKREPLWRNWSGSVECSPHHISHPLSVEEVQADVSRCAEEGERLRVIGSGRSFSPLCWSDENLMSLEYFNGIEWLDPERRRVWVRGGTPLRELMRELGRRGLALPLISDTGAETVAGAASTGMHGSGVGLQSFSNHVTGLKLVCADGSVRTVSTEESVDLFDAARLALGALGVITHVELQCVAAHRLRARVEKAPLGEALRHLDQHAQSHHSFRFEWFPHSDTARLFFLDPTEAPSAGLRHLHRLRSFLAEDAGRWLLSEASRHVPRLGVRTSRLHARVASVGERVHSSAEGNGSTPRLHRYNEVEFSLPVEALPDAVRQIDRLIRALNFRLHLPLSVSFQKSDSLWLSPAYRRNSATVAIRTERGAQQPDCIAAATEIFDRYDGRPHWGKLHGKTAADFAALYPKWNDFLEVRRQLDPRGVFLNPHLCTVFGVDAR